MLYQRIRKTNDRIIEIPQFVSKHVVSRQSFCQVLLSQKRDKQEPLPDSVVLWQVHIDAVHRILNL